VFRGVEPGEEKGRNECESRCSRDAGKTGVLGKGELIASYLQPTGIWAADFAERRQGGHES
jgi:hypothetical protein